MPLLAGRSKNTMRPFFGSAASFLTASSSLEGMRSVEMLNSVSSATKRRRCPLHRGAGIGGAASSAISQSAILDDVAQHGAVIGEIVRTWSALEYIMMATMSAVVIYVSMKLLAASARDCSGNGMTRVEDMNHEALVVILDSCGLLAGDHLCGRSRRS